MQFESKAARERLLLEAYRLSERRLEMQISFAMASDQRSLVLAGVSIATSTFVAVITQSLSIGWWGVAPALVFGLSAVFAILSAIPTGTHAVGNNFSDIKPFIEEGVDFLELIESLAENNDLKILQNEETKRYYSQLYLLAMFLFFIGIFLTFITILGIK